MEDEYRKTNGDTELFLKIYLLTVKEERTGNYISYSGEVGNSIYTMGYRYLYYLYMFNSYRLSSNGISLHLYEYCLSVFDLTV